MAISPLLLNSDFSLWKVFAWLLIAGFMLISVPIGLLIIMAILGSIFMSLLGGRTALVSLALQNPSKAFGPAKIFFSAAITVASTLSSAFFLWAWTNIFSMGYDNRAVLFAGAILGLTIAFIILMSTKKIAAKVASQSGFASFTNMNANQKRSAMDDDDDIQVF